MNEAQEGQQFRPRDSSSSTSVEHAPFRLFIESVRDYAIFMLDPEGHVQTWNLGARRVKGYEAEEIVGKHFSVFYTENDRSRGHPAENLGIARREGRLEEEGWRIRKDGSRFWANVVITAIRDASGELVGFGKVTRDLTERKRQEERERKLQRERIARREAEAADRAKSEFLAAMSHELRTPLNALLGYLDLMEQEIQGPLTDQQRNSLNRMRKSSRYLLHLVEEILDFTRLREGGSDYRVEEIPVNDVLDGIEPLIAPQMDEKAISFTCTPCDDEATVLADPEKVQQILLNLLSNARKYTPEHGRVTLTCERNGDSVCFRVTDTGRGIPDERLSTIFEPFVQVDRHLQETSRKGVGLGLTISRKIARGMNGDLTVESEVDAGSTFTLELPSRSS